MNSAEFKTIREACGLSVPDMARISISPKTGQPVGERTVRYWEAGGFNVPTDVINMIKKLNEKLDIEANEVAERTKETLELPNLTRYRTEKALWKARPDFKGLPTTCYAAMLHRTHVLLDDQFDVCIDWDDDLSEPI